MVDPVESKEMSPVGVVLVAYHAADDLAELIPLLLDVSESIPLEIVIIDNDSDDGTPDVVRPYAGRLMYIRNERNVGFAAAVNQAVARLETEYILLLNPDCRIGADVMKTLVSFLDDHPDAGAAAPRIVFPDGRLQPSRGSFPNITIVATHIFRLKRLMPPDEWVIRGPLRFLGRIFRQYAPLKPVEQVDYTIGACVLIRKDVFTDIGGMDDCFFLYYEEIDLAFRMRSRGYHWYFLNEAEVVHETEGASGHAPLNPFYQRYRSMVLYFRKHKSKRDIRLVIGMIGLMARIRLFLGRLSSRFRVDPQAPWEAEEAMLRKLLPSALSGIRCPGGAESVSRTPTE